MSSVEAAIPSASARSARGQLAVAMAALAWSTAGVLQRQLTVDVATQVAGRALFAGIVAVAYLAVAERGRVLASCRCIGRAGVAFAACMALSSGAFIVALNHASVAQVLFIQAIAPVLAALLGRWVLGERLSARTAIAMALALLGVGVMVSSPGGASTLGDGLALLMALGFAGAIVIARRHADVSMAPATGLAQVMLLAIAGPLALAHPVHLGGANVLWLALFGAGQIGLGMILLTIGARLIPAAQVALISLLEVVLGPLWVWLAVGQRPTVGTLIGGAIVIAAVTLQVRQ